MPRCDACNRSFGSEEALRQHMKDSPAHLKSHCNPCSRSFDSDEALRQHMKDSPAHGRKSSTHAPAEPCKSFFTFPQLHQAVLDEAPELSPAPQVTEKTAQERKRYVTCVMAKFSCTAHGSAWSSKKVSIVIRLHQDNRYSAVVYNQRCRRCERLGVMKLDETSYVERVAYRLKKWAGIPMEEPEYTKKNTPPHLTHLCEGCKAGVCSYGAREDDGF